MKNIKTVKYRLPNLERFNEADKKSGGISVVKPCDNADHS
jgi:hypothetical protein